jgi:hypothetical protein
MSFSATIYNVMIASPGDVAAERSIIREVLSEWNVVNADMRRQVLLPVLLPVGWETHAVPEMGDRPQTIINRQILRECDLLVGVFWTRIGTATTKYPSGTVEEIEEHIKSGRPVMLYFSAAPAIMDSVDPEQYRRLVDFRSSCQTRGLYESYTSLPDFRAKFYRQLQLKVNHDAYFKGGPSSEDGLQFSELPRAPSLSKEAAYLLKLAAADPTGQILYVETLGGAVLQVQGRNLIEEGDARSLATWAAALDELEQSDLIAAYSPKRNIFKVTRKGFDVSDRLP